MVQVRKLAKQIALGLSYLHSLPIIHRDLHIKNVLMRGGQNQHAVIADFNCGRKVTVDLTKAYGGMVAIVPPECRGKELDHHDNSYDMYGYGLLVAQLVRGVSAGDDGEAWEEVEDDEGWKQGHVTRAVHLCVQGGHGDLGAVIRECLNPDPVHRPRALDVVNRLS